MEHLDIDKWSSLAVTLLKKLIAVPSFSKEEEGTAALIMEWFEEHGIFGFRRGNNVCARGEISPEKKTLLLLSHHDTVKPSPAYTRNPFDPVVMEGKLFGLGSNDAGSSLAALATTFLYFIKNNSAAYNLVFIAAAEEEISGAGGISMLLRELDDIDCAIVGEPTQMQMAVAERGLLVLDCVANGTSGHAARNEGDNALYKAIDNIQRLRQYRFERVSELLGEVTMSITSIHTENEAHNVVPDVCEFVADVRINELYTSEEVLEKIKRLADIDIKERSLRLRSSMISLEHDLVQRGFYIGMKHYGSPTLSDKALLPFPALKLGPGDSARSHTADEFIYLSEIKEGVRKYIDLIKG